MPDTYIPIPVETVQEAEELPSKRRCSRRDSRASFTTISMGAR